MPFFAKPQHLAVRLVEMILSLAWPFISLFLSAVRRLGLLRLPAPSASAVLRQGPPCAVGTARPSDLELKLADVLKGQIERGTQLGGAICVYHKGRQVAHVVGGVYRTCDSFSAFKPVNSTTLFFVNSVSKGISAAAFMTFLDERGKRKIYDSLVGEHWPEFSQNGKQNVTVEQLLSHRAGLAQVGLLPSDILQLVKHLYLYPSNHLPLFTAMTSKLESAAPEHEPGTSAAYHALSNSFIMGGLIDRLTASKSPASINDFIHSRLCDRLKLPHSSVHLGRIPDYVIPNLAATEPPPNHLNLRRSRGAAAEARATSPDGSLSRWFATHIIGPIEAFVVSEFIILQCWRSQCLPGNNGAVTAGTLGKIFGALANYGEAGSHRFVSSSAVKEVAKRVKGEKNEVKIPFNHPDGEYANLRARRSCGFFPWTSPELHGDQYNNMILSSEGMGGGFAMADPTNKLAIVYTKSVYEPLSVLGGSISVDSCEVAKCVRDHLGIK